MRNPRNLGEIPQNIRPEYTESTRPIPRQDLGRPRDIALRGKFSTSLINVTDVSRQPLNANPRRVYLIIQNNGANDVYVNFANKATLGNIRIIPSGNYEPIVAPTDSLNVICGTGLTSNIAVIEGVEVGQWVEA